MSDVKQSGVVFSIPQLDSIAADWEINSHTGAVRVKAPKTGLEHGAYPDYDKYANKTAKSVCRVLRRKLPRSNIQRKTSGKNKKKRGKSEQAIRKSPAKTKARQTPERASSSRQSIAFFSS